MSEIQRTNFFVCFDFIKEFKANSYVNFIHEIRMKIHNFWKNLEKIRKNSYKFVKVTLRMACTVV